jgi:hypothetical protein
VRQRVEKIWSPREVGTSERAGTISTDGREYVTESRRFQRPYDVSHRIPLEIQMSPSHPSPKLGLTQPTRGNS